MHPASGELVADDEQVDATVTADKDAAWVFNLEGEYKDDVFTGRIVSPDGLYTLINQPPPPGPPYGAPGSVSLPIPCASEHEKRTNTTSYPCRLS